MLARRKTCDFFMIATTYLKIIRGSVEFIFVQVDWAKTEETWEGDFSVSYPFVGK